MRARTFLDSLLILAWCCVAALLVTSLAWMALPDAAKRALGPHLVAAQVEAPLLALVAFAATSAARFLLHWTDSAQDVATAMAGSYMLVLAVVLHAGGAPASRSDLSGGRLYVVAVVPALLLAALWCVIPRNVRARACCGKKRPSNPDLYECGHVHYSTDNAVMRHTGVTCNH